MKQPRMFYKTPGPHNLDGGWYEYIIIDESIEGEVNRVLAEGWANTPREADAAVAPAPEQADDNAPPTRGEMEQKAKELGIKFDGRTSDKTLMQRITEALA